MEFWTWEPEALALVSEHVEHKEALPETLLQAMLAARHFQSGMQALRQLEFSLFDLQVHRTQPTPDQTGIQQILDDLRTRYAVMATPDYNRFQNSFSHIFAGGYAAGYYSYKWAEVLASDAFERFEQEGIFNVETGQAFRREVLSVGGSRPAQDSFAAFRGRAPSIDALLRHSGWIDNSSTIGAEA
jgi:oligopeptidase A